MISELDPNDLVINAFTWHHGIRIEHAPSGLWVECNLYKSQHENKDACLRMLEEALWSEVMKA